jgi:hypothetical protein
MIFAMKFVLDVNVQHVLPNVWGCVGAMTEKSP